VSGVPAHRLPAQFLAPPKNNLIPIDISRLSQEPPRQYLVDADDILGIYIEGVLGNPEEPPPVHLPQPGSDLPPAIGFPIPVREDGTLPLPLIQAIRVRGLTLTQIENIIRRAYTIDNKFLPPGKDRIIVTLMRKRTFSVVVMRQDGVRETTTVNGVPVEQATRGQVVDLEAYKNDVMHALAATGGLPGLTARNEVLILRASLLDAQKRDQFVQEFFSTPIEPCMCRPPLPPDPAIVRIPLRLPPGEVPAFRQEDIILEEGDIVLIEGREREVFYTGGILPGGEHPLPRDYDLDVLGAMAIVGGVARPGQTAMGGGFGGGFNSSSIGGVPPGQLYILRKTPCNGQITIAVDLTRAIRDPAARPLVQPGDYLILQYKPEEELLNFGLGTFFTYGIFQLLQNDN
jgi:protein involved in polysaccharide export with SLBB domain